MSVKIRRQNTLLPDVGIEVQSDPSVDNPVPGDSSKSLSAILSKIDSPNLTLRKRRYHDTSLLITEGASDYECSVEELLGHQTPLLQPLKHPNFFTLNQATERVEDALAQSISIPECPALARLNRFFNTPPNDNWGPDIVFKAFADLDLLFFLGELRGHVYLRWSDSEEDRRTKRLGNRQVVPWLPNGWLVIPGKSIINMCSRPLLLRNSRITVKHVIQVLLHEMIHAYLTNSTHLNVDNDEFTRWNAFVAKYPDWKAYPENPSNCHGTHFVRLVKAINERSKRLGLPFDLYDWPMNAIEKAAWAMYQGEKKLAKSREKFLAAISENSPNHDTKGGN